MAFAVSRAQIRSMVFNDKYLKSAIYYEAISGYSNSSGRNMRFNSFLYSKLLDWSRRSKHESAKKLLEGVKEYDTASMLDRSNFLDKVSVLLGYDGLHDLMEHEKVQYDHRHSDDSSDISLVCSRFPSIMLGSTSFIELYDKTWDNFGNSVSSVSASSAASSVNQGEAHSFPSVPHIPAEGVNRKPEWVCTSNVKGETEKVIMEPVPLVDTGDKSQNCEATIVSIIDRPVDFIPGISTRHCRQLEKYGFYTMRKLLKHFPRTYADLHNGQGTIEDGQYFAFVGKILSSRGIKAGTSLSFLEIIVGCLISNGEETSEVQSGKSTRLIQLHLKKFFGGRRFTSPLFLRSIQSKHKVGDFVSVSGKVKAMSAKDHFEIREYNIDVLEEEAFARPFKSEERLLPIYPSKGGLNSNFLKGHIRSALQFISPDIDPIPKDILKEFSLFNLYEAYMGIHCPRDLKEADLARRRMIFDEFFYLQLARLFQMYGALATPTERTIFLDKFRDNLSCSLSVEEFSSFTKEIIKSLPYTLTQSQVIAASEIISDLRRPVPMNRLLQGDVGCGKTVVAFIACIEVVKSGYQAAIMVPTELLALQHYEHIVSLLENVEDTCKPNVALLTGSTPSKQSRFILQGLRNGDIDLVIGTHSLISETIEFSALRLAVIDEQHRFGVIQRGRFNRKLYTNSDSVNMMPKKVENELSAEKAFMAPHVLAISATPIPRTLALLLYGDMSLSQITDLPPGRLPIQTYAFEGNEAGLEKTYQLMQNELQTGGKVYVVYPVIEESEHLPQLRAASADLASMSSKFQDYQCGLLHGRMKSDEKEAALRNFRSGEINILLSTQVIEIGVDVPDASLMVVMNAERFGIAQLHQLRGRVGRGLRKSTCIFLSSSGGALGRLKILEESSDGFHLANVDLLHRGPGDLLGKKQSGHLPDFPIARLEVDGNILREAQLAALKILGSHCGLDGYPKIKAELSMRHPLCLLGD
ncbi:ATP-dependent DNA helicase homolog RECG, chloroplastic isoform X2 [Nymphaea colorata]|uniref:ATP-dependent DNA helicase homolog RECG, chloroplastic isoform X2 n=1 Tax=Nymphaea colorata TaxID=210225 RepID=UPI00129EAFFB|nr:ATP-dependent DNA helicase homolog RECG, chloroplastic isoform X2 [Nymphaea colorata]